MSYYYDDEEKKGLDLSKARFPIILGVIFVSVLILVSFGLLASSHRKTIDIATSLPAGAPKIVLTQDLAKEHMVTYLENQRTMIPFTVALTGVVIAIMAFGILSGRRRNSNRSAKFIILVIVTVIMAIFMGGMILKTLSNTSDPESQTPTIAAITIADKHKERHTTGRTTTTYYYITSTTGQSQRVTNNIYNMVDYGHKYYFGYTEQNSIFAVYDSDVYTLPA